MTDILLPPWVKSARVNFRYLDSTGVSRPEFGGILRTASRGGDRLAASLEFTPQATSSTDSAQEHAALIAFLNELEGKQNRAYLTNPARRLRGSFPATELLSNNTFPNGTTGWTDDGECALSVHDRTLRVTALRGGAALEWYQSVALTQYAPYALRGFIVDGPQTAGLNIGPSLALGAALSSQDYSTTRGLKTVVGVALDATPRNQFPAVVASTSGFSAGAYISVPYVSLSRCALVDNSPNAMTRSDELDHADWTKTNATASANSAAAPDGSSTADSLIEDSSPSTGHFVGPTTLPTRASAVEDVVVYGDFKRGAGTRDIRLAAGADSTNFSHCIFDLGAGTAGSVVNAGTATNGRAFIRALGNGWYRCYVVAHAPASTTIFSRYNLVNAGSTSYTGDGSSSVLTWRRGCARSSLPVNPPQTVASALPNGTAQTGRAMYVKGLPVSTNGLLLPGDEFEVITSYGSELKIVTAALNSDAAGLGYLQFKPALRGTLSDNAAIIVHEPFGRFVFNGDLVGWDNEPGIVTRASAEFEEAA